VRLAFAVAAHLEPEILVVDEVLAVGDAAFQKKCLGKMGDVSKEGRTVLFVSHNLGAVRSLCAHGILLDSGELIASGPMDQVADQYARSSRLFLNDSSAWTVPPDENLPLQVISINAVDSKEQPCSNIDVTEQIHLIITHHCSKILIGSVVLVSIFHNGIELIHTFDTDAFPQRLACREIGRYADRICLPRGLFKAGMLTISIRTAILNKNTTFQDEADVLRIDLGESSEDTSFKGYAGNRSGLLRISPHWETENQLL
jgi:lipopolysaccharide transport system ATP-binding protein